jgi:putative peptide zinc metalloprotease protein
LPDGSADIVAPVTATENVYVDVPGKLVSVYASHGDPIESGQPILSLKNDELEVQLARLQGNIQVSKSKYDALLRASHSIRNDQAAADELELAYAELETARADLRQRQQDLEMLEIKAGQAGYLIPPTKIPRKKSESGALENWHGHPLEQRNIGGYLEQSTLVARIVPDKHKMEAVLMIDQSDIEFVDQRQSVELFLTSLPDSSIKAEVSTISPTKMKSVPQALSSRFGGPLVSTQDDDGIDIPQSATFQVSVPFENPDNFVVDGCTGYAKVCTGSQTVGRRIWRLIQKTFRFDL